MKIQFQKAEKDPTTIHGVKVPYTSAKRKSVQWRWYLILLIVSSPLLFFLYKMVLSYLVVTAQGYISLDKVSINSTSKGVMEALYVETGQEVKAGTRIAQLYAPELEAQKQTLEAELASLVNQQPLPEKAQAQLLRSRIELAKQVLDYQDDYLKTMLFLFDQGAATLAELTDARERQSKAQADYDDALFAHSAFSERQTHAGLLPGMRYEADRKRIEAHLKSLEESKLRLAQMVPYSGKVLDVLAAPGEVLSPGVPIVLLGRSGQASVVCYLDPKYSKYARNGRTAVVKLPDGITLNAVVRENANLAKRLPADLSSPIGSRDLMLFVNLAFLDPLPSDQWVDGLPVSVRFR